MLGQARTFRELLLRPAALLADARAIVTDELAHVHALSIGEAGPISLSTIICIRVFSSVFEFGQVLADVVPLASTLFVRHAPQEDALRRVMPWIVVERPDLWLAYQQIQWPSLEKAMTKASYIVSFVGHEPRMAAFANIYRIGKSRRLDLEGYRRHPGNAELERLGMSGRAEGKGDCLAFNLEPLDFLQEYSGRLTVRWPLPYQNWWRRGHTTELVVETIERDSLFAPNMPDWRELVLTHAELESLPSGWRAALAEWRGVYFIYDTGLRQAYVGSAYGADNIFGRWLEYSRTGHGGNIGLAGSASADLHFSILQRTSPDLEPDEVIRLETTWKQRLHTREFGLNRN